MEPSDTAQRALQHQLQGEHLRLAGEPAKALAAYAELLKISQPTARLCYQLSDCFYQLGDMPACRRLLDTACELADQADAWTRNDIGQLAYTLGHMEQAQPMWEMALQADPCYYFALCNRIFGLLRLPDHDPARLRARIDELLGKYMSATGLDAIVPLPQRTIVPKDRLHIGYLGSTLRAHASGYTLLPLLREHDHQRFRISCYSTWLQADAVTERYKALPGIAFEDVSGLDAEALARRIQADEVDILIDLAGYESHWNGIFTLKYRPAPIQVSWLIFIATYGLPEVDYIFTHRDLTRPAEQPFYTERFYELDSYCCYERFDVTLPPLTPLPSLTKGCFTFGVFNQIAKITGQDWWLWARILQALPHARLLFCRNHLDQAWLEEKMAVHGIEPSRALFLPFSLENYLLADLQLDTTHYNGMTVTLDSLLMGIPVLTLPGSTMTGRMASHLLGRAGMPDWIADDADDYVGKAIGWACRRQELGHLRAGLREQLLASPLCDAAGFARGLEKAYVHMWKDLCLQTGSGSK